MMAMTVNRVTVNRRYRSETRARAGFQVSVKPVEPSMLEGALYV